ncbi:espin-like isoform X2 [Centruroides sculpturatus]|uniref:espin-like isoform X2 n=1 Tax=Centruroides sculpturatus TaxID=218467 RepID=UPI000C6E0AE6|nr:espin-like isoform X2 [Centruroides sculpturatus]
MPDIPLIHRALVAAREGDLQGLQVLKKNHQLTPNIQDDVGATCVHYAARGGNIKVLNFLIKKCGMKANTTSHTGATPLHDATAMGKLTALVWLVNNTECSLHDRDADGATVLHIAARCGSREVLKWLLHEGQMSPTEKTTRNALPLHYAAASGCIDCVKMLVEATTENSANFQMENNVTPVYLAAQDNHLEVLKYLVVISGGSLYIRAKDGMAPIHASAQTGAFKCLKWMVSEQGVDPNLRDNDGATAVHFAASRGHLNILRWLLKHGGRIYLDKYGKSPLNDAADNGHLECLTFLVSHASESRHLDQPRIPIFPLPAIPSQRHCSCRTPFCPPSSRRRNVNRCCRLQNPESRMYRFPCLYLHRNSSDSSGSSTSYFKDLANSKTSRQPYRPFYLHQPSMTSDDRVRQLFGEETDTDTGLTADSTASVYSTNTRPTDFETNRSVMSVEADVHCSSEESDKRQSNRRLFRSDESSTSTDEGIYQELEEEETDEGCIAAVVPPPPPPPPLPINIEKKQEPEEKSECTEDNATVTNELTPKKLYITRQQLSFIPPQFDGPPEVDINIKPSEYLKKLSPTSHKVVSKTTSNQEESKNSFVKISCYGSDMSKWKSETQNDKTVVQCVASVPVGISLSDQIQKVQLKKTDLPDPGQRTVLLKKNDVVEEGKKSKEVDRTRKLEDKNAEANKKQMVDNNEFTTDNFVEKMPSVDTNGCPIPLWKRQVMAKKAAEKARKEAEELKQKEEEEQRQQSVPVWKRQLLQRKETPVKVQETRHSLK